MATTDPLTDADGEVRELTATDMEHFRPATHALSDALLSKLDVQREKSLPAEVVQRRLDSYNARNLEA